MFKRCDRAHLRSRPARGCHRWGRRVWSRSRCHVSPRTGGPPGGRKAAQQPTKAVLLGKLRHTYRSSKDTSRCGSRLQPYDRAALILDADPPPRSCYPPDRAPASISASPGPMLPHSSRLASRSTSLKACNATVPTGVVHLRPSPNPRTSLLAHPALNTHTDASVAPGLSPKRPALSRSVYGPPAFAHNATLDHTHLLRRPHGRGAHVPRVAVLG